MFIYNFKVNGSKAFKIFFISIFILLLIIIGVVIYKVFDGSKNNLNSSKCLPQASINHIKANNYTNILKAVHDAPDNYIGTKIKFTGYIYRVSDLKNNQFVLARDMIISSSNQTVVVGFLCETDKTTDIKDDTWVDLTGTITKGNYHGVMPIVKVTGIHEVSKPTSDEYVYPPDETYIPTDNMI